MWFVVVWADGQKEPSFEDYPPWSTVADIWNGVFVWDAAGSHSSEYTVEWLPEEERQARWAALGVTLEDF